MITFATRPIGFKFTWPDPLLIVAMIATVMPVWFVAIPPATDLPQHLGQIFLLEETLAGARPELVVTPWFYPNTLIYALLYAFWQLTDPLAAGRITLSVLAGSWVLATYVLCASRQRPVANWLIGVPLVFNFLFYWGLLNFIVGWPIFCLFITVAGSKGARFKPIQLTVIALLLYYASFAF